MRWVPTSKPIDLSEWTWCNPSCDAPELVKVIDAAIGKAATETLTNELKEHPPTLTLPIKRASRAEERPDLYGEPVKDPATIHLRLPFDKMQDGEHVYEISLAEVIPDEFWSEHGFEEWDTPTYQPSAGARAFAARLRELADLVERGPDDWGVKRSAGARPWHAWHPDGTPGADDQS
jgi:hypothetical protein